MPINTRSAFIYGHQITGLNSDLNFDEGGGELTAIVNIGSYTLDNFLDAVALSLNEIGDNEYTVTVNRTNMKVTIAADNNFDLLVTTGSNASTSVFSLLGFTTDRASSNSYEADNATGSIYYPQAPLYDYVSFDDIEESIQAKVNESANGDVEVVTFGTKNLMECNIKYATNIVGQGFITNNAQGVSDLRVFMQYITKKRPIEFVENILDFNTYESCFLESTPTSRDGTGFMLKELYSKGLANYFETGKLVFRKLA